MSGRRTPPRPERIRRFSTLTQVPLQDLLTLRRSLQQSAGAAPGPDITIESELLSIVDDEVIRRGLKAVEVAREPPSGTKI